MVKEKPITKKEIQELLNNQTTVILDAVDERIEKLATKIDLVNLEVKIDKKMEAMEERWSRKFDKLTTTLDKFLKRMTDNETELIMVKNDLRRIKQVIKEKLGVEV